MIKEAHKLAVQCTRGELKRVKDKLTKFEPYVKSLEDEAKGGVCVDPLEPNALLAAANNTRSMSAGLIQQVRS